MSQNRQGNLCHRRKRLRSGPANTTCRVVASEPALLGMEDMTGELRLMVLHKDCFAGCNDDDTTTTQLATTCKGALRLPVRTEAGRDDAMTERQRRVRIPARVEAGTDNDAATTATKRRRRDEAHGAPAAATVAAVSAAPPIASQSLQPQPRCRIMSASRL